MSKEIRALIDTATSRGWVVVEKSKGLQFKHPNGIYHVHTTTSDFRALRNASKALTRIEQGRPCGAH